MSSSTLINSDITDGTINDAKLNTISTAGKIANSATTATDVSTASTIVLRNGDTKVNNLSANSVLANTVKSVTSGYLDIQSNGNVNIDIDNDNNETSKTFTVTTNNGASTLFQVNGFIQYSSFHCNW
ncbi:hypothetical protein PAPYR_12293 [Paratrimastix pyriformis]|uniref:Uncharacterized protein n=1 Tax=Paratrimastix pyriformis TaxID=342808 RepID=A0ABQ8U5S8_9EUKA|nr:hypothetical protein PAPYR_12293 [Paratrimastix pyriformis]